MSIYAHFLHTFSSERATRPTGVYGQDRPTWANHLSGVMCRLVVKAQRVEEGTDHEGAVVSTYTLLVPESTDLKQGDRVTQVVDDKGTTWGPFDVREVLPRRSTRTHHITFSLERANP